MRNLWLFDKRRLTILSALSAKECSSGCDLRKKLKIGKNLLSYHLKILEERGFVRETKAGRQKEYRLSPERMVFVAKILKIVKEK